MSSLLLLLLLICQTVWYPLTSSYGEVFTAVRNTDGAPVAIKSIAVDKHHEEKIFNEVCGSQERACERARSLI
jgi:hypothetical protein